MAYVWLENRKTEEIHRAWTVDGARLTGEACNLDAADEHEITEEEALAKIGEKPSRACGHCLAKGEAE